MSNMIFEPDTQNVREKTVKYLVTFNIFQSIKWQWKRKYIRKSKSLANFLGKNRLDVGKRINGSLFSTYNFSQW